MANKFLIQMSGAPGSGKSTISNLLARAEPINGVVLNHDLIKSFFLENGFPFDQSGKLTYSLQWVLAEDMMKQGRNVIIDCPCNFARILEKGIALAHQYGYEYKYVECKVKLDDIDMLDQRLRDRPTMRSMRTGVSNPPVDASAGHSESEYRALFKKWIENPCRPPGDYIVMDTSLKTPEECLHHILKKLDSSL